MSQDEKTTGEEEKDKGTVKENEMDEGKAKEGKKEQANYLQKALLAEISKCQEQCVTAWRRGLQQVPKAASDTPKLELPRGDSRLVIVPKAPTCMRGTVGKAMEGKGFFVVPKAVAAGA